MQDEYSITFLIEQPMFIDHNKQFSFYLDKDSDSSLSKRVDSSAL